MRWAVAVIAVIAAAMPVVAQSDLDQKIDSNIGDWVGTYQHFHANPELSTQEKATSELIAGTLRKLGYDVTDHFGKYEEAELGVVWRGGGAEKWAGAYGVCEDGARCAAGAGKYKDCRMRAKLR